MTRVLLIALVACSVYGSVVGDIRYQLGTGDLMSADAAMEEFCQENRGTSECAAAISWMARGAEMTKDYAAAQRYVDRTSALTKELLKTVKVEDDAFLATAVGATYEVEAHLLVDRGKRDEAVAMLKRELPRCHLWAIQARLRKNLNALTLVGTKAPVSYPEMKGKPSVLFLWGHWCGDCKAQSAVMGRIWETYKSKGLVMVAPTRRIGSVGEKDNVPAAEEDSEIEKVWKESYSGLSDVSHPIDEDTMLAYGASSTPTLVLVDRKGLVRMYEPYRMSEEALSRRISELLR
jgi:thiol-disulfide isomerase/thioredoxin